MAPSTARTPSLSRGSLRRQSSTIRTGCANERPSGSARGVPREWYPYRDPTENRPGTRDETVEGTPSSRAMVIKPILAEEISENPRCSGNREGLGGFAPIRMIVGIRKNQRYPHE